MAKPKVNYKKIYREYFNLDECDLIMDEYEWLVNGNIVPAVHIHHIEHGCNKVEHITNYMALGYKNHTAAHREELNRKYLKELHLQFLTTNPY